MPKEGKARKGVRDRTEQEGRGKRKGIEQEEGRRKAKIGKGSTKKRRHASLVRRENGRRERSIWDNVKTAVTRTTHHRDNDGRQTDGLINSLGV